jgi:hypothetical protein
MGPTLLDDFFQHVSRPDPAHQMCGKLIVLDGNVKVRRTRCSNIRPDDSEEQQQLGDPTAFLESRYCQNDPARGNKQHYCKECAALAEEAAAGAEAAEAAVVAAATAMAAEAAAAAAEQLEVDNAADDEEG